ncbi:hypothetical protein HR060_17360 [Catenovulum sp. SM1970]|uniref:hypothetical protein n=1 Tax=Marinifaba aquimaris TaxID=2741323 RepID=UPI001571ACE7|nr:hypothetical protein [Marinifaba aquimaris]NTS78614.1 hypothetical protein [Marinifaba aquimaris]
MKIIKTLLCTLSLCLCSIQANAGVLFVDNIQQQGNQLTFDINGSGFTDGLSAGAFFAGWDNAILNFTHIDFNDALFDINGIGLDESALGFIDETLFAAALAPGANTNTFNIASLSFDILATGDSVLFVDQGFDLFGPAPFFDGNGGQIDMNALSFVSPGLISVTKVNTPTHLSLMLIAIFALALRQKRA